MNKTQLPNGVRLLLIPMEGVNSVATSVLVGVGSRYETPQTNGVSHFLEHMVFKGTQKYPTTDDVNIIEKIGGLQNAYTDIDVTSYHNKVLSRDWHLALEVNKELALAPLLKEKHIAKERSVILEEMKRYEDEPAIKVEETFHQMLYPATRLGMRIIGEEKSLRAVGARELRQYHDYWYQPTRIVIVLAGKLKAQSSKLKETVGEWFGGLKPRKTAGIEVVKPRQTKPKLAVVTKPDAQQAHLIIGTRTFPRDSEERFAWVLFNLIMGVSFTSRLFREIREKRGLCYHIRSSSSNYAEVGSWDIYAGVATEKVTEAVQAVLAELGKVKDQGITEEELGIAKKRLATLLSFKSEDPEFFTEWYGRQEVYGLPILTVEEYLQKIDQVTKSDVSYLAKKYLRTETLNMALVWSQLKDAGLLDMMHL